MGIQHYRVQITPQVRSQDSKSSDDRVPRAKSQCPVIWCIDHELNVKLYASRLTSVNPPKNQFKKCKFIQKLVKTASVNPYKNQ